MLLFLFVAVAASLGAISCNILTCSDSEAQCADSEFQVWICCTDDDIAFPPVARCGALNESKCFSSTSLDLLNVDDCDECSIPLTNLSIRLSKLIHVYAVTLNSSQNDVHVQVEFKTQSNWTTLTDCILAGALGNFLTFYCGQPKGILGDGVRISKRNPEADIVIRRIRIYDHQGVGCGYPGVDKRGSFEPKAESYPIGSRVRYECKKGTILVGPSERICSINGLWDGAIPHCVPEVKVDVKDVDGSLRYLIVESPCSKIQQGSLTFKWPGLKIHRAVFTTKGDFQSCALNTEKEGYLFSDQLQLESKEINESMETTVYRNIGTHPTIDIIDEIHVHCSSPVELCRIQLTKKADLAPLAACPSPDGVANGNVSIGQTGLLYTCLQGYGLGAQSANPPLHCDRGQWSALPPVCTRILCGYPQTRSGFYWKLLNGTTVEGSWAEYRPLDERGEPVRYFACNLNGQWEELKTSASILQGQNVAIIVAGSAVFIVAVVFILVATWIRRNNMRSPQPDDRIELATTCSVEDLKLT